MSNYPQPGYPPATVVDTPPSVYPPQRRSGCGGCLVSVLIFLGVIFLLAIALCCGGFYYLKSSFVARPAEVQQISDEIASLRVPPPLEPVGGGRIKVPFVGTLVGEAAIYSDKGHTSMLILGSFGNAFGEKFKDDFLKNMESGQFQPKAGENRPNQDKAEELKDIKKTRLEPMIGDQKAGFEITQGVGVKSNKRKIRVQGGFLGKSGPAMLIIDAEEQTLSAEKVKEIIESIKVN